MKTRTAILIIIGVILFGVFVYGKIETNNIVQYKSRTEETVKAEKKLGKYDRDSHMYTFSTDKSVLGFTLEHQTSNGWELTEQHVFYDLANEGYFFISGTPTESIYIVLKSEGYGKASKGECIFGKQKVRTVSTEPVRGITKIDNKPLIVYETDKGKYRMTVRNR